MLQFLAAAVEVFICSPVNEAGRVAEKRLFYVDYSNNKCSSYASIKKVTSYQLAYSAILASYFDTSDAQI